MHLSRSHWQFLGTNSKQYSKSLAASLETAADEANDAGDKQEDGDDNTDKDVELCPILTGPVQLVDGFVTILNIFHTDAVLDTVFCPLKHKERYTDLNIWCNLHQYQDLPTLPSDFCPH